MPALKCASWRLIYSAPCPARFGIRPDGAVAVGAMAGGADCFRDLLRLGEIGLGRALRRGVRRAERSAVNASAARTTYDPFRYHSLRACGLARAAAARQTRGCREKARHCNGRAAPGQNAACQAPAAPGRGALRDGRRGRRAASRRGSAGDRLCRSFQRGQVERDQRARQSSAGSRTRAGRRDGLSRSTSSRCARARSSRTCPATATPRSSKSVKRDWQAFLWQYVTHAQQPRRARAAGRLRGTAQRLRPRGARRRSCRRAVPC